MKKSVRWLVVAFSLSLVPLLYMVAEQLALPVVWEPAVAYIGLGLGLLCLLPIWVSIFERSTKRTNYQAVLGSMAAFISYGYAFISGDPNFYWQPTSLTSIMLLGSILLQLQLNSVHAQVKDLTSLLPEKATLIDGREVEHIAASELEVGHVVLVRPGGVIPSDGYVLQGQSLVSQEAITGEKSSIVKVPGDWVLAGSLNVAGKSSDNSPLTIRVSAVGEDLLVHELARSVQLEYETPVKYEKFSHISASLLTAFAIAGALIAAGYQFVISASLEAEFSVAAGILLAAQASLLVRSVPLAVAASAIKTAALGVIMNSRESFQALAKVNHVVLKKTGVLTRGPWKVGRIHLARNTSIGTEEELLALAAAVEMGTSHELGHLIIQDAARRGLELPAVTDFAPIAGLGVSARFEGSLVQVGNSGMVNVTGVTINPYDLFQISTAYAEGSIVVFVSLDELLVGYIEFPDEVRPGSQQAIVELSGKQAITVLSGDATSLVEKITTGLGLTDFAAEVLSTKQLDWIKERRATGSKLLLVADGHYDAASLAEADVALAFGAGHDVHLGVENLVQVSQDPLSIPRLLQLSKRTQVWSFWNIVFGLVASVGLMVASFLGVWSPIIALAGLGITALLILPIVRLAK
jgi:Cu2+-exporting ATPase